MRPDKNISACEALIILSRLYTVTAAQKAMIAENYAAEVRSADPASYSWASP